MEAANKYINYRVVVRIPQLTSIENYEQIARKYVLFSLKNGIIDS